MTDAQQTIVNAITSLLNENDNVWPPLRAIAKHCGIASTNTVHYHIKNLEAIGILERFPNKRLGMYRFVEVTQ